MPLSAQTRTIVTACIPALEAHGLAITQDMYRRLLSNENIRDLFNISHQKNGDQPRALAFAILAYARHIDDPTALKDMIERIAEKHVGLNILPEHYPHVGKALLEAIAHVLGDQATPDIMEAWKEAYGFLADVLINREQQIYHAHAAEKGGWTGWRSFRIAHRHEETADTVSFTLSPADGQPVMRHRPGQYLSFRLNIPGAGTERRNYSISSAPAEDHYRITIKRQAGGVASCWFHDHVQVGNMLDVSAPAGDFTLPPTEDRPVVFLSAGSGITPVMSMLDTLAAQEARPPIHVIHGTQTPQTEIFARRIRELAKAGTITADLFYSQTGHLPPRMEGITAHTGRLTSSELGNHASHDAEFYVCGPTGFLITMIQALRERNIPRERIHYEMFGSASDPFLVTQA
ncbi:NO-inducible flavohemoprotein [Bombella sp. TMW 2.2559]|uniref:nitric oxide dioxygenase n=2 Tax=Bombella dulcis TaxID=2967339 RepID=A0ABT3WBA4_9PROT|nr:NO-inducible flavohemoprotein [Bombella dulcis]MCX5615634.1 NO-inducible flavohemoprotein [Bombella dulcis]